MKFITINLKSNLNQKQPYLEEYECRRAAEIIGIPRAQTGTVEVDRVERASVSVEPEEFRVRVVDLEWGNRWDAIRNDRGSVASI